jgi:pimeloyl-ACP methyl ester carboxylesterase
MPPPPSHTVDLHGPIDAPPLVFVHGAGLNRRMWLPYVDRFQPHCRLVIPDLPGHGSRAAEPFRLARAADAIAEALDLAGVPAEKPAVLAGDSLGGYVSIRFAATRPSRVAGLVIGGCTANFTGIVPFWSRAQGWLPRILAALMGEQRFLARAIPRLKERFPEAPMDAIAEVGIVFAARDAAIAELAGVDFRSELARVRAPVTLVNGEDDRLARRQETAFRDAVSARLVVVPGIGHGVSLLRPTLFGDAIAARLADLR